MHMNISLFSSRGRHKKRFRSGKGSRSSVPQKSLGAPDSPDPERPTNITTLVLRAAFMDPAVYEVIRNHSGAMLPSIGVVVAVALLIAVGQRNVELAWLEGQPRFDVSVIGWVLWSLIAMLFGGWVFKGQASRSQVLRALAIATAPAVLLAFRQIDTPLVGQTVGQALYLFGVLWTLVIGTQAIKQTMRLNWLQAAVPGFLGWGIAWIVLVNVLLQPVSDIQSDPPSPGQNVTSTATLP